MHVHACGSLCSRHPAHLTRSMVTICMPSGIALHCLDMSMTSHTSHCAHAMLHWLSPSRSLVHSTVASPWYEQPWHMEPVWGRHLPGSWLRVRGRCGSSALGDVGTMRVVLGQSWVCSAWHCAWGDNWLYLWCGRMVEVQCLEVKRCQSAAVASHRAIQVVG